MSENAFEMATSDEFPIFRAKIHWLRATGKASRATAPGSRIPHQRVWLGARELDTLTALKAAGGVQLAAECLFGYQTDAGQDVELSFWFSGVRESLTTSGTDLALVEGDRVVASGTML